MKRFSGLLRNARMRVALISLLTLVACASEAGAPGVEGKSTPSPAPTSKEKEPTVKKTEAEWKAALPPMTFHVLREKGTERAFTGALWDDHAPGTYVCAGCGALLFKSTEKFESGCGWPSFSKAAESSNIIESVDFLLGYPRTELTCAKCGGHLGHVFKDGPPPTGLRYCINSAAMVKVPSTQQ